MKRWTPEEMAILKTLHGGQCSDDYIATRLGRNTSSVQNKRRRLCQSFIICKDCGEKVNIVRGKRLRCKDCAERHVVKEKRERAKVWYQQNKDFKQNRRDRVRFGGNREKAIQRDNEQCQLCGCDREHHKESFGKDLTVYHIDGKGRGSDKVNNDLDNLITLCLPCQGRKGVEQRVQDWSMVSDAARRMWNQQREYKKMGVVERLNMGLRPQKTKGNLIYWR